MSKLTVVTVDLETYWSKDHTLSKMNPIVYALHEKTEIISCSIKIGNNPTQCFFGHATIQAALDQIDEKFGWGNVMLVAHNMSGFDAMLFAWRFNGVKPRFWACTLAMARPIHAKTAGGSLAALVKHYGIGEKNNAILLQTQGKNLKDFSSEELAQMAEYNKADTDQCYELFKILFKETPKDELRIIDQTIRMLVEPKFELDTELLKETLEQEIARKNESLLELAKSLGWHGEADPVEFVKSSLASSAKFAKLLNDLKVDVPTKVSPTDPDKRIPALSKTDEAFLKLKEHPNELVAAAACARLDVKSTMLESRITSFLEVSEVTGGVMPIALNYYGADTTGRWSGSMKLNHQNLPRVNPNKPKPADALRYSLRAPKGYMVVVADLSGIELRINHFLWKVPYSMALFQADPEKADPYKYFAAHELYHIPESEVSKDQRRIGKIAHLGLGFGAGHATFRRVAKVMGGVDLALEVDEEGEVVRDESMEIVNAWRAAHPEIVEGLKTCHAALYDIKNGNEFAVDPWEMITTCPEGLRTPKGIIRYPGLRQEKDPESKKMEWWYGEGRHKARIYGGKIDENCLAAGTLVLTDSGWKPIESVLTTDKVHDGVELVNHAGVVYKSVQQCVSIDGVLMTPDHEVLTNDGWKEASQFPEPFRPEVRSLDRLTPISLEREDLAVGVQVRLRDAYYESRTGCNKGSETRRNAQLRVHDEGAYIGRELNARHDQAPGLRSVAFYVGQMQSCFSRRMEKLRCAWDYGMRQVENFVRELLGGHGCVVPEWAGLGQGGQRRAVFSGKLPLGFSKGEYNEPADNPTCTGRTSASCHDGRIEVDALLQTRTGSSAYGSGRQTQGYPVFDVLNAGPRNRFVVLGENGPFVVHNCVQHLARCVIADNSLKIQSETGYAPSHTVHDELIYVVPEHKAEDHLAIVQQVMRTPPKWWPELVTWSEGDIADNYGKAK